MTTNGDVIRCLGVSKIFANGTVALQSVDLSIHAKELVVFLGPSGCGKTTLLRILGGLLEPSSGKIAMSSAQGSDEIAFVFQDPALLDWRSVSKNVSLPLEIRKIPKAARRERVRELLSLVGLSDFANALPRELSGGMRQRVAIARALSYRANLLMMDEPFGALDAQTRDDMNIELQRIWMHEQKTAILVTHSIPEAVFLADRIVVMAAHPGRIADIVEIPFERPRRLELLDSPEFGRITGRLRSMIGEGR